MTRILFSAVVSCCMAILFVQGFSLSSAPSRCLSHRNGVFGLSQRQQEHFRSCSTFLFQSSSTHLEQQERVHEPLSVHELQPKFVFGGDFCGLSASFSATTGQRLPIPDHWIPPSLKEWGQEPSSLEVIVSEELQPTLVEQDGVSSRPLALLRQTITILPETGCAVDNLETIRTETKSTLSSWNVWPVKNDIVSPSSTIAVTSVAALTVSDETQSNQVTHHLEANFGLHLVVDDDDDTNGSQYRVRVQLQISATTAASEQPLLQLQAPVQIHLERQWNTTSSRGTRADGGGLDGRTVSQLMGNVLRKQHGFAEKLPSALLLSKSPAADQSVKELFTLALPANVTVAINELSIQQQVIDIAYGQIEENPVDGAGKQLQRTVVRFSFPSGQNAETKCWSETISL